MQRTGLRGLVCASFLLAACGGGSTRSDVADAADGADPGGDPGSEVGPETTVCTKLEDCAGFAAGPCELVVCKAETGTCVAVPDATKEGLACDDGDLCTETPKTCRSGACTTDAPKTCPVVACHGPATCEPKTGECTSPVLPDTTSCDLDGFDCTKDYCKGGACTAGLDLCECGPYSLCPQDPDQCKPRRECKDRVCVDLPESVPDCTKPPACQDSTCSPASGDCVLTPQKDGTLCDDKDPCTGFDACAAGACVGKPKDCDDQDACTADSCGPDAICVHVPIPDQACDDNDPCTTGDRCDGVGKCTGKVLDCDDKNPCTADSCLPLDESCAHEPQEGPCDDGNACTDGDACVAGACVPGDWVAECCNQDADCDDQDACTIEACSAGTCDRLGEADPSCATANGCEAGYCSASDKTCGTFDLSLPRLVLDWDFRQGQPPGFSWKDKGSFGDDGLAVKAGKTGASLRLPARFLPQGVSVIQVDVAPGSMDPETACKLVTVQGSWLVEASGTCAAGDGVVTGAWALQRGLVDRLDVTIGVGTDAGGAGPAVRGVRVYAWAAPQCRPLLRKLASGSDFDDLAVAGGPGSILAGFRKGTTVAASGFDLKAGALDGPDLVDKEAKSTEFSTSMLALADGRFLFAFGEVEGRVHVVLLDRTGKKLHDRIPDPYVPQDQQTRPRLVGPASGPWFLAWVSSTADGIGLSVILAPVTLTGDKIDWIPTPLHINKTVAGDQTLPAPCLTGDSGMMFWVTGGKDIVARLIEAGKPVGGEVSLASADATVSRLTAVRLADTCAVLWQTGDGRMAGKVVTDGLEVKKDLGLPGWPGVERYTPSLVPAGGGALLGYTRTENGLSKVVQVRIDPDGKTGDEGVLAPSVYYLNAAPALGPGSPFHSGLAYQDTVSLDKGPRLGVTSAACGSGPVLCDPMPAVCVGFGTDGYVEFPSVVWGCP